MEVLDQKIEDDVYTGLVKEVRADLEKSISDLHTRLYDGPPMPVAEWVPLSFELEDLEIDFWLYHQLPDVERRLTPSILSLAIRDALNKRLGLVRHSRDLIYQTYEEDRKKGVSFTERRAKLAEKKERLVWYDAEETRIVHDLQNIRPTPVRTWLDRQTFPFLKRLGLREFIRIVPNIYYE